MTRRLRVVQIGTGHDHAADHVDEINYLSELYELVGVCEPDPARRAAAEKRLCHDKSHLTYGNVRWLTMDELLAMDDLDAAIIETPELSLVENAQLMADKGLAIHMDKPCGVDYLAFEKLVETMRSKGLPLHIGYMYRYNAAVMRCREMVKAGKLGDIFSVETQMSVQHDAAKREWLRQFKGGMMFFLGCHMVDMVCMMCGEPEEVIPYNTSSMNDGIDTEDLGFAVFRYPHGVSFVKTSGSEVNGFERRQVVVNGTKGSFHIQPIEDRTGGPQVEECSHVHISFLEDGVAEPWGPAGRDVVFGPFGRYTEMMTDFAAVVRGDKENSFDYDYELMVQRTLLKACGNFEN